MRRVVCSLLWVTLSFAGTFLLDGAAEAKTQGYRECVEMCFIKECGEVGLKCPTSGQKAQYKSLCRGRCREKMRRQHEQRKIAAFQRYIRLQRERAARYRQNLLLRHRLWKDKKVLLHRLRVQYRRLQQRAAAGDRAQAMYTRMTRLQNAQLNRMQEILASKENFYRSRMQLRDRQHREMQRRVSRLRGALAQAKAKQDASRARELQMKIAQHKKEAKQARHKKKQLQVNVMQVRVQRSEHKIKKIQVKRQQLKVAKKKAVKKQDQQKLKELARKLGRLAGLQAAASQEVAREKKKLAKARLVLSNDKME